MHNASREPYKSSNASLILTAAIGGGTWKVEQVGLPSTVHILIIHPLVKTSQPHSPRLVDQIATATID